jgi:hypothetical protein
MKNNNEIDLDILNGNKFPSDLHLIKEKEKWIKSKRIWLN